MNPSFDSGSERLAVAGVPVGAIRPANAHGTPFSGIGYFLVVGDSRQTYLRVFTTETSYQPSDEQWRAMWDAQGSLVATVHVARFASDVLVTGNGPFVSDIIPFTIGD